jgi:uncharacterized membrane protein YoaK (UPF0700 family)
MSQPPPNNATLMPETSTAAAATVSGGSSSSNNNGGKSRRSQTAVAIGATIAGLLSFKIADWMLLVVPQRELLLALTILLALAFYVLSRVLADRFYKNDLYVDEFEQFVLAVLDFIALLLIFVAVQYAAQFLTDLFVLTGPPPLPTLLLCLAVLLVIAFAVVPYVRSDLLAPAGMVPGEEDDEAEAEAAEQEEDENDEDEVELETKEMYVGRADD